jgi:hypothetical protein
MDARTGSVGFVQTCQTIYTQEGMVVCRLAVSLIRVIPTRALPFSYELILRYPEPRFKNTGIMRLAAYNAAVGQRNFVTGTPY